MRKMKSILGILILSIGILGTGYAYWCDTLTAEATVSTGSFDVDFGEVFTMGHCTEPTAVNLPEADDKIVITTGEMVPGSWAFFNMPFINNGANRAILQSVDVDYSRCASDCPRAVDYYVGMNGHWYWWSVDSTYQLDDVIEWMFDHMYPYGVKEGKTMSVQLMPYLMNQNDCQEGQDKSCTFDLEFNWIQGNCGGQCVRTLTKDAGLELIDQAAFEVKMAGMGDKLPVSELNTDAVAAAE